MRAPHLSTLTLRLLASPPAPRPPLLPDTPAITSTISWTPRGVQAMTGGHITVPTFKATPPHDGQLTVNPAARLLGRGGLTATLTAILEWIRTGRPAPSWGSPRR